MSCCGRDEEEEKHIKSPTKTVADAMKALSIKDVSSGGKTKVEKDKAKPMYAAIWLDKASQKNLKGITKPVFKQRFGNHVTIVHGPSRRELDALRGVVGRKCAVRLISEMVDEDTGAQLVTVNIVLDEEKKGGADEGKISLSDVCQLRPEQKHHVTISTKIDVPPHESNQVISRYSTTSTSTKRRTIDDTPILYGYFGVTFKIDESLSARVALREVRDEIMSKVTAFIEGDPKPGDTLIFPPGAVLAKERFALHNFAKSNGTIKSASDGPKSKRRFVLTKKKEDEDEDKKDGGKHHKAKRGMFTCSRLDVYDLCLIGCAPANKVDDEDDAESTAGDGGRTSSGANGDGNATALP